MIDRLFNDGLIGVAIVLLLFVTACCVFGVYFAIAMTAALLVILCAVLKWNFWED